MALSWRCCCSSCDNWLNYCWSGGNGSSYKSWLRWRSNNLCDRLLLLNNRLHWLLLYYHRSWRRCKLRLWLHLHHGLFIHHWLHWKLLLLLSQHLLWLEWSIHHLSHIVEWIKLFKIFTFRPLLQKLSDHLGILQIWLLFGLKQSLLLSSFRYGGIICFFNCNLLF